jgi:hypothetical protein
VRIPPPCSDARSGSPARSTPVESAPSGTGPGLGSEGLPGLNSPWTVPRGPESVLFVQVRPSGPRIMPEDARGFLTIHHGSGFSVRSRVRARDFRPGPRSGGTDRIRDTFVPPMRGRQFCPDWPVFGPIRTMLPSWAERSVLTRDRTENPDPKKDRPAEIFILRPARSARILAIPGVVGDG